jgi:biotin carboxyl carrier protein
VKYFVTVNGQEHEVELEERLGRIEVRLDGAPLSVRYEEVDRLGQVALFLGERAYGVSIEGQGPTSLVTVAGHVYQVTLEDERERAAHAAEREGQRHGGEVKSIMPGVVVELLVSEGQEVEAGTPLLILEAMKMQNEISAPGPGRVARLHVARGEAVGSGAKLITLAPTSPPQG